MARRNVTAVALALLLARVAGADDSSLVWRTVRTPHFTIHYHRPLGELAQRLARRAEQAHAALVPRLAHAPDGPTHIVLVDDTDSANGSAQTLPYNRIVLYATAPEAFSVLGDYDDWLLDLVMHEYTHVVHLDTIHGFPRVYNAIFGKTLSWNQVQPKWFIEGLATYEESARTASGRGRSSLMHMFVRAAVLEDAFPRLDVLSAAPRAFPRGTMPYLYGAHFLAFIAEQHGEEALARISHDYAGNALPFALNRSALRAVGKDYPTLYSEFHQHVRRRYALERDEVRARGETSSRRLTFAGETASHPRFLPDGRILFFQSDGVSHAALRAISPKGGQPVDVTRVASSARESARPSPSADGRRIVMDQLGPWRTFYSYSDLWLHDSDSGRTTQLTHGLRARDPDLSPDGRTIVFSQNGAGASRIARIALDPTGAAKVEPITPFDPDVQAYTPSFSPDGNLVAWSGATDAGFRDLFVYDARDRSVRRLWKDRALDLDPRFSRDGRWLFFASDRTGIYNVYAYELAGGRLWQVTNVVSGAFMPEPSPDGKLLAFIGFSHTGFDLHVMDLDPARWPAGWIEAMPHADERPAAPVVESRAGYKDQPYDALETFYPRSWELDILGLLRTPRLLQAGTRFSDVASRHRAAAAAGWRPERDRASFALRYANSVLWPTLGASGGRSEAPRGGFVFGGQERRYIEESWRGSISAALPIVRRAEHSASLELDYRYEDVANADADLYVPDPGDPLPRFPETGVIAGVGIALGYSGVRRYAWSISSEEGRALSLGLRSNREDLGSDFRTTELTYGWSEFVPNPVVDRHVLALRLRGGIGKGNLAQRGIFAIGGAGDQDFVRSLLELQFGRGTGLRGYPP
ncbi:MAG: hypothetical protein AABZ30_02150, partial [Myxococcota bacterium]